MSISATLLPAFGRSLCSTNFTAIWCSHSTPRSSPDVLTELSTICNPFRDTQRAAQYAAIEFTDGFPQYSAYKTALFTTIYSTERFT